MADKNNTEEVQVPEKASKPAVPSPRKAPAKPKPTVAVVPEPTPNPVTTVAAPVAPVAPASPKPRKVRPVVAQEALTGVVQPPPLAPYVDKALATLQAIAHKCKEDDLATITKLITKVSAQ